jgi:hypothetical protein
MGADHSKFDSPPKRTVNARVPTSPAPCRVADIRAVAANGYLLLVWEIRIYFRDEPLTKVQTNRIIKSKT